MEGDKVAISGVVSYEHPGNDWVEVRFAEGDGGTAIIPRNLLPAAVRPKRAFVIRRGVLYADPEPELPPGYVPPSAALTAPADDGAARGART